MPLTFARAGRRLAGLAFVATAALSALLLAGPLPEGDDRRRDPGAASAAAAGAGASSVDRAPADPLAAVAAAEAAGAGERAAKAARRAARRPPEVRWRDSEALGLPYEGGRLVRGVRLPRQGRHFFTWDPIVQRSPNRPWRRWGTDRLVRTTLRIVRGHGRAHPGAPRVAIGDLSRPRGGDFGPQFGGIGHASHQNGVDVDIYYPRRDERERAPSSVGQVNLRLAQDLVDRFVRAGATHVFVGPSTGLEGPPGVVQPLEHHDDHLHVRIAP